MTDQIQKKKPDTTRIMRDVTDLPPSAFALNGDKRNWRSLQHQRKLVATAVARHADSDGTNSYPSIGTLMKATGLSRATIFRLLKDLRAVGILRDGDIHGFRKTRVRSLDITKARPVSSSPDDPSQVQGDPSQVHEPPVSSSQGDPSQVHSDPSQSPGHPSQSPPDSYRPIDRPSKPFPEPSIRPTAGRAGENSNQPANREETAMEKARRRKDEYQRRLLEGR